MTIGDNIAFAVIVPFCSSLPSLKTPFLSMATTKTQEGSLSAREIPPFDGVEDDAHYNAVGILDKGYTSKDQRDMQRLGKRQELIRNFRPLSALAFTVLLQATWEFLLM